ncbi:MAG: hypothetical protein IT371_13190 [Deltaproteobacteria bacterium]|nr:hypothetical protein [Deltaproteobacteria bacterium]
MSQSRVPSWPRKAARHLGAGVVLGGALLLAAGGCVDETSFLITQNQVPQAGCKVDTNESVYRAIGTLDVSAGKGYVLFPLIRNDLQASKGVDNQPERNALHLREFQVELDLGEIPANFPAELLSFTKPTSGVMQPGERRASSVEAIPEKLVKLLSIPPNVKPIVTAKVRVVADHGVTKMKSAAFFYPIQLCNGCLVVKAENCPTGEALQSAPSNTCGLPQDESTTCCNAPGRGLVCLSDAAKSGG